MGFSIFFGTFLWHFGIYFTYYLCYFVWRRIWHTLFFDHTLSQYRVVQKQPKIKSCLKLIFFIFQYFFKKILWQIIWVLGINKKISLLTWNLWVDQGTIPKFGQNISVYLINEKNGFLIFLGILISLFKIFFASTICYFVWATFWCNSFFN